MNGLMLSGTPIAVDFWRVHEINDARIFFLSHFHSDHMCQLTSSWRYPIYCSPITAKLLITFKKIPERLVRPLEVNQSHIVALDDVSCETMTVTLVDAHHCPGSVMFLFQGYFGNILYTGDFRYDDPSMLSHPVFLEGRLQVDRLYVDNTYCSPDCANFPSRREATEQVIKLVRQDHDSEVFIALRKLGKESLLVDLAKALQTWIVVSPEVFSKLKILDYPNVFTTELGASRIRAVPFHEVTPERCRRFLHSGINKALFILPTCLFRSRSRDGTSREWPPQVSVQVVDYSDHSSFDELLAFVARIRPGCVHHIVDGGGTLGANGDQQSIDKSPTVFKHLLSGLSPRTFEIPHTVKSFMNRTLGRPNSRHYTGGASSSNSHKRVTTGKAAKGVVFFDDPDFSPVKILEIPVLQKEREDVSKSADVSGVRYDSDLSLVKITEALVPQKRTEDVLKLADVNGVGDNPDFNLVKNLKVTMLPDRTEDVLKSVCVSGVREDQDLSFIKITEAPVPQTRAEDVIKSGVGDSPQLSLVEIPQVPAPQERMEETLNLAGTNGVRESETMEVIKANPPLQISTEVSGVSTKPFVVDESHPHKPATNENTGKILETYKRCCAMRFSPLTQQIASVFTTVAPRKVSNSNKLNSNNAQRQQVALQLPGKRQLDIIIERSPSMRQRKLGQSPANHSPSFSNIRQQPPSYSSATHQKSAEGSEKKSSLAQDLQKSSVVMSSTFIQQPPKVPQRESSLKETPQPLDERPHRVVHPVSRLTAVQTPDELALLYDQCPKKSKEEENVETEILVSSGYVSSHFPVASSTRVVVSSTSKASSPAAGFVCVAASSTSLTPSPVRTLSNVSAEVGLLESVRDSTSEKRRLSSTVHTDEPSSKRLSLPLSPSNQDKKLTSKIGRWIVRIPELDDTLSDSTQSIAGSLPLTSTRVRKKGGPKMKSVEEKFQLCTPTEKRYIKSLWERWNKL